MPVIRLQTLINAPVPVVFDLSRSIDLHKISTAQTNEEAIAGTTSGLIALGESVTWKARHFGIVQTLTSKITEFEKPHHFTDEMVSGAFDRFKHKHIFKEDNGATLMTDIFDYTGPYGVFGRIADVFFLKRYMTNLLAERNRIVKEYAEDKNKYLQLIGEISNSPKI
ncbi:MAG: cell division protein [Flavobacterium psychrophilum]|nr:MAG: cell division protein [Flavobacterium psychrophilum]